MQTEIMSILLDIKQNETGYTKFRDCIRSDSEIQKI